TYQIREGIHTRDNCSILYIHSDRVANLIPEIIASINSIEMADLEDFDHVF
ncbi:hypothetical protein L9F63_019543, partial [Diploptera punctata]